MRRGGSMLADIRRQGNIQTVYERIAEVQAKQQNQSESIYKQMREGKLR